MRIYRRQPLSVGSPGKNWEPDGRHALTLVNFRGVEGVALRGL
jgi:hypothetical protein